jgi:hypothetical protein
MGVKTLKRTEVFLNMPLKNGTTTLKNPPKIRYKRPLSF